MTDYVNHRKFYTAHNEFLSGVDIYSGYVIRTGDSFTDTYGSSLTAADTFSTDLVASDYFRDRTVSRPNTLPYQLSSVQIKVNDILTNRLINDRFSKLHNNNIYLYSQLQIPTSWLPASNDVRYAALTSIDGNEQFEWFNTILTTEEYKNTNDYTGLENINRGVAVLSDYDEDVYTIFCTTSSSFIALTGSPTSFGRIQESTYVSQSASDYQFNNITALDYDDNTLLICDKGNKAIYKYDIESYSVGDTHFRNRRILVESLGGIGKAGDKGLLVEPTLVSIESDAIAVYDGGGSVIKIYDKDFNFRQKLTAGNFKREPAVSIKYNSFTDELYVITLATSRALKLYKVQADFTVSDAILLEETLDEDEDVKEITFSQNDSNYWYIVTTKFVYKKLVSRPTSIIGAYDGAKIFAFYTYKWNYSTFTYNSADFNWNIDVNKTSSYDNFIGLTCAPSTDNYDRAFLLKYGRFYAYNEPNTYLNTLNFFNKENYSLKDIKIDADEFVQPLVYNKEIYKLISNLLILKNNIIGRYYGSYDLNGMFRFAGYNYLINLDDFVIDNIKNYALHLNEGVNFYTINRTLRKLLDLQQTLMNAVELDITGLVPYPLTSNTLVVD